MATASPYHFTEQDIASEQEIITNAKKDPNAFAPLYNKYHEQIFMFILKRVESTDVANDITSQVFLKALVNLSKYNAQGLPFASWLYRIARNEVFTLFKKNKVQMVVSIDQEGLHGMIAEINEDNKEEEYAKLKKGLKQLPGDELEIIEMRFFEKRSFKEIGEVLDITENNAKVKTYRIIDKLKSIIQHVR